MASANGKSTDAITLRLGYQRKASEYLLRMSSCMDSNTVLLDIGRSMVSRLRSQPVSVNNELLSMGNGASNAYKQARRMQFLKAVTTSQDLIFNYFRGDTEVRHGSDGQSSDIESSQQSIGYHIDQIIQSADSSTCLLQNTFEFACASCGVPYLLGPVREATNTTTIRLRRVQRGKSRRRRSLRYRQRQAIMDQQMLKHQGGGKKFAAIMPVDNPGDLVSHGSLVNRVVTDRQEWRKQHELIRVRDGCSTQKVVYSCSYCNRKSCYKGLPAFKRKLKRIEKSHFDLGKPVIENVGGIDSSSASSFTVKASKKSYGVNIPQGPKISLQANPLKKRKKEGMSPMKDAAKKGKSSLMDFLSSLND